MTTAPRSLQVLDHADDLVKRFEDHGPSPEDETAVAEHLLRRAVLTRVQSERQFGEAGSPGAPGSPGSASAQLGIAVRRLRRLTAPTSRAHVLSVARRAR